MDKPILAAILSCSGIYLSDEEKYLFSTYNPLGVSLFSRNLQSKEQTQKLITEIKNTIGREDVLVAIDQEGGRVSRLDKIGGNKYVSSAVLGKEASKYSRYHALLISEELRELGINTNYSPVIDKIEKKQNKVLEHRCFSSDEENIVLRAKSMAKAYIEQGICPCIKHLPGHFDSTEDPHLFVPKTTKTKQEIEDYIHYINLLKDFPLAMTSHIFIPSIDDKNPATHSSIIISELIRGIIGFDGFLLSDALDMHALSGDIGEKANLSLDAGVDAVCYCSGKIEDLQAICMQKRFLTEKTLIRFAKIKKIIHNTPKHVELGDIKKRYVQRFSDRLNCKYSYDATEVLHQMLKKGEN